MVYGTPPPKPPVRTGLGEYLPPFLEPENLPDTVAANLPERLSETALDTAYAHAASLAGKLDAATAELEYAAQGEIDGLLAARLAAATPTPTADIPTLSVAGPGGSSGIASPVVYTFDTTAVRRVGCVGVTVNALSTDYIQNQVNGETGSGAQAWAVETVTDSPDVAIPFRCAVTGASLFWVWVDGRPISRSPYKATTNTSANSKSYFRMVFPDTKRRTIRVYMGGADFGGLQVATGKTATATTAAEPYRLAVVGDSWTANAGTATWPNTFSAVLGRMLGAETFLCGRGGTGYVATSTPFGHTTRLANLTTANPSLIIVEGSINDNASYATVGAAATAYYNSVATNLPSAKLIVVGPQPVPADYATSTNLLANRDAVKAAALAAPNVLGFIDPIEGAWLSGTGKINTPTGSGNRDYYVHTDQLHLTRSGGHYWASRTVRELLRLADVNGLDY